MPKWATPCRVGCRRDRINPLGAYAMRLSQPEYIIHGTNKPYGVGMRVSHGCIRLYPEDIETLFPQVRLQTPVRIINQPYKVGRHGDQLYLEAHPYLEEDAGQFQDNFHVCGEATYTEGPESSPMRLTGTRCGR